MDDDYIRELVDVLDATIAKEGCKPLTNVRLRDMLLRVIGNVERADFLNDLEGMGPDDD